jgi:hypothetical protein
MSDGHFCFVKDLGPVKGGKGMKHHEVIVDLTIRGVFKLLKAVFVRPPSSELHETPRFSLGTREPN